MKRIRLGLQFFAEETLDDLLGYLGVENGDATSSEGEGQQGSSSDDNATTDESGTQTDNNNQQEGSEGEDNGKKDGEGEIPTEESQRAFAFAQLRQEAAQKKQLLGGLQKLLNIPENTPIDDVMTQVQNAIVKAQSKQSGIPEEILTKLNSLEARDKEFRAHQLQESAYLGFNKIQKNYGLSQEQVKAFAVELMQSGVNPFEQEVDVLAEYKVRHFDDIVQAKVNAAVQAEQERAAKAGTQSTQPGNTQGQSKEEQGKINSVKDLDNWFNAQSK